MIYPGQLIPYYVACFTLLWLKTCSSEGGTEGDLGERRQNGMETEHKISV